MSYLIASGLLDDLGINFKVLGIQVFIFLTTFFLLTRILFGRVLQNLQRREEEIQRSRAAIERDRKEVEDLAKQYREQLARIDKQAYDRMQDIYREAMTACGQIVGAAQAESRAQIEAARSQIAKEKQDATAHLRSEVSRLTIEAVEKVLETRLDPKVHGALVDKFLAGRS